MRPSSAATNILSIAIGAFLVIEGIWGLFSNVIFGVLTTNIAHAVIHILLGITAIVLGLQKHAKGFSIFLGLLLVVVGLLWFIHGPDKLVINLLNLNRPVAILNMVVALLLLSVAAYKRPGKLEY